MLGSKLLGCLTNDFEVYGCGRGLQVVEGNYAYERLDLTNTPRLRSLLKHTQPQVIFHLAAKTQVDDCERYPEEAWRHNSFATQNLLKISKSYQPIVFYLSTDYVFNGTQKKIISPQHPVSPASVYGKTKAEGEAWVKRYSQKGIIVRTSWVYGPGGKNFVDAILDLTSKQKELRVVRDQIGRPTYTGDLARGLTAMLKRLFILDPIPYGIYHFTGQGETSWYEFAKEILKLTGQKKR